MDTMTAIATRRSIRRFDDRPLPRDLLERILQAGIEAPSAKNRQPWRFVVVTDDGDRPGMLEAMRAGLAWYEANALRDENDRALLGGAHHTLCVMAQAPATVFVLNPDGAPPDRPLAPFGDRFHELANAQSVGACIQNMCLAATALGVGSLWICDVFQAYPALVEWLGTDAQLVAAVSFGYALEDPARRPRRALADVATWR